MEEDGQTGNNGGRAGWAGLAARGGCWLDRHARVVLAVYWPLLVLATHWPRLDLMPPTPEGPDRDPLYDVLRPDKVLHLACFGGLMVLLILARLGGRGRSWAAHCGLALAVGVGFAVLDEATQGLMPERIVSASDLIANLLAMLGVYLIMMLPAHRTPTYNPRRLRLALLAAAAVLTFLALSPWVMNQMNALRVAVLGKPTPGSVGLDHVAHGVVSAVMSVLVIVVWPMASRRPRRAAAVTLAVLGLMAPGLEVAQSFTGRGVEWEDELAHVIGLVLAMIWWAARLTWSPRLREPAAGLPVGSAACP